MTKGGEGAKSSLALYRKYRSRSLADIVGQDHITGILQRAIKNGRVAHAYLFTGPRGVGKTSIARILAHAINNLDYTEASNHPDIIEIDAASNRRIDDIRDLREKVQIAPASAKKKIYIIDEVHMLTGESFNAFLKTLEEPPEHVVFILATTDAHKLPETITSRTQRFTFRSIAPAVAVKHLADIAKKEGIKIDDQALTLVAEYGEGSFRDSISLLDQLSSLADPKEVITREKIENSLGMAPGAAIETIAEANLRGDNGAILSQLSDLENNGVQASVTARQLIKYSKENLAKKPQLIDLLGDLVEVINSPRPDVKLITALLAAPKKDVRMNIEAAATPELSVLNKEATRAKPSEAHVRKEIAKKPPSKKSVTPSEEKIAPQPVAQVTKPKNSKTVDFDWAGFLEYFSQNHVALASILKKCKGESDGETLTIYTGSAFWKNKLDAVKYQPTLHEGLVAINQNELSIETLPIVMPPKDSQAAAVAAIMGGGEEVEVE